MKGYRRRRADSEATPEMRRAARAARYSGILCAYCGEELKFKIYWNLEPIPGSTPGSITGHKTSGFSVSRYLGTSSRWCNDTCAIRFANASYNGGYRNPRVTKLERERAAKKETA